VLDANRDKFLKKWNGKRGVEGVEMVEGVEKSNGGQVSEAGHSARLPTLIPPLRKGGEGGVESNANAAIQLDRPRDVASTFPPFIREGQGGSRFSLERSATGGLILKRNNPRLSLCMIVRDNETTIGPCLASIRPYVDEIVVVDTGSKDRTVEICRRYGARIFEFAWCDDFSAARNESLKHARGEWLFWMDSDDTIPAECARKLRALVDELCDRESREGAQQFPPLRKGGEGGVGSIGEVAVELESVSPAGTPAEAATTNNILGYIMQVHCPGPSDNGHQDVTVVDHAKLIRNGCGLRFEGRIHEQLLPAIRRAAGGVSWTDIYVVHSGSDHSPAGKQRKLERDLRILNLELAEQPAHPFVLFNFGMTYADVGRYDEAIDFLNRCLAVSKPEESHLRKAYAILVSSLGQRECDDEAWQICQQGLALYPGDKELLFRCAMLHHHFSRLSDAEQTYLRVINEQVERHFTSIDRGLASYKARHNLAIVYEHMERLDQAEVEWRRIVAEVPDYYLGWRGLGGILVRQGKLADAEELCQRLAQSSGLHRESHVLRARLAQARGDLASAVRELRFADQSHPADLGPLRTLCSILCESDQAAAAEAALRELTSRAPDDAAAHHDLGTLCSRNGAFDEAIRCYRRSLELRPNARQTERQLHQALEQSRQLPL
jgi:glycosyltransferase involved in cell wall biosynthesis